MATFYVSAATGDDSHTALEAQDPSTPKKTIRGGIACLTEGNGDTLVVRYGIYAEALNDNIIPSGVGPFSTGQTTIKKFPGDPNPEMRGNIWTSEKAGIIWDGINLNGIENGPVNSDGNQETWTNIYINGGSYLTFKNCEVYNAQKLGILVGDGNGPVNNILFQNLKVHDCGIGGWSSIVEPTGGHGFYISAANHHATGIVLDRCESYNNTQHANTWGIQVFAQLSSTSLDGVIVRGCYIHDNTNGLVIGSGSNHQAYNNVIVGNGSGGDGEGAISVSYGASVDNVQLFNNTIYANAAYAIDLGRFNSPTNTLIKNNIFWQNGHDAINTLGGSGTVASNNGTSDPQFLVPGSDFHLEPTSPAIGAGLNLSSIFTIDKDGNLRPSSSAWALGAYETGSGAEGSGGGTGGGSGGGSGPGAGAGPGADFGASGSRDWLVLASFYLDSGTENFSSTRVRVLGSPGVAYVYEAECLSWGSFDRSITIPPGVPSFGDGKIRVKDTDRKWRDLLFDQTPLRRLIDIRLCKAGSSVSSAPVILTVQVIDAVFGPGYVEITFADNLSAWMDENIPAMITAELYPDVVQGKDEGGFLPIIFGQMESGDTLRGRIPLPHVGLVGSPAIDRYGLAMHPCYSVVQVFRKKTVTVNASTTQTDEWEVVDPGEYTVTVVPITAFNLDMHHSFLDFSTDQKGAEIRADVHGIFYDGDTEARRNPIDFFIAMVFLAMNKAGLPTSVSSDGILDSSIWDSAGIAAVRSKFEDLIYVCDCAITETLTARDFLGRFLASFNVFLFQNKNGLLTLSFIDTTDENPSRPLFSEGKMILKETFYEYLPNPRANQFVYSFKYDNAEKSWLGVKTYDTDEQNILGGRGGSPASRQPLVEKEEILLYYVSQPEVALDVITRRSAFMAFGSYRQEFECPLPPAFHLLELATFIGLKHHFGLATGGYLNQEVVVTNIIGDLDQKKFKVKTIRRAPQQLQIPGALPGDEGFTIARPTYVEEFEDNPPVNPTRSHIDNGSNAADTDDLTTYASCWFHSSSSLTPDYANLQLSAFRPRPTRTVTSVEVHIFVEYNPPGSPPFGPHHHVDLMNARNIFVFSAEEDDNLVARLEFDTNMPNGLARTEFVHTISAADWETYFSSDIDNVWVRAYQMDSLNYTLSEDSEYRVYGCYLKLIY